MAFVTEPPAHLAAAPFRGAATPDAADDGRSAMKWVLPAGDLSAVPRVRRTMVSWLRDHDRPDGDLDAAALVIGEILANAVEHTAGPAWVSMTWEGIHPQMRVTDSGSGAAARSLPAEVARTLPDDEFAESGRGLHLATLLSRSLHIARNDSGGSVVSATLDLVRA